jgi:hypothetical protein
MGHMGLSLMGLNTYSNNQVVDVDVDEQDRASTAPPVHCRLMSALLEAHVLEHGI